MAKRAWKYKLTKRDSALSLLDGGNVAGPIRLDGTVTLSGNVTEGGGASLTSNQLYFTSSAALTGSGTAQLVLIKG